MWTVPNSVRVKILAIDIEVVVTMSYCFSAFRGELRLALRFLLEILWFIKLCVPDRIYYETRACKSGGNILKEDWERSFPHKISKAISVCLHVAKKTFYGMANCEMALVWHQFWHWLGNSLMFSAAHFGLSSKCWPISETYTDSVSRKLRLEILSLILSGTCWLIQVSSRWLVYPTYSVLQWHLNL